MRLKTLLALLLACLLPVGCAPGVAVEKPKPAEFNKPSLMYSPGRKMVAEPKYPVKLGVLNVQDKRIVPFWYDADDFFAETISAGLSANIYRDIRFSGIFSEVVRIPEPPPAMLTAENMLALKNKYGVDMILVTYVNEFYMSREKTGDIRMNTYILKIHAGLVSQLIYLQNGVVVWAEKVDRMQEDLTGQGVLSAGKTGELARQILRDAVGDMKTLMIQTGKVMRRAG